MIFTNKTNIPLSLSAWLAHDEYTHSKDPNTISATALLRPIRAIVLARQNRDLQKTGDLSSLIPSRMGIALHDSIEKTWKSGSIIEILKRLGYSDMLTDKLVVNPDKTVADTDIIPVYTEYRSSKELQDFIITGEFDFVGGGILEDFKSTSVFTVIFGSNDEKWKQQGSIYRWLNPEIITEDFMYIQLIFTDWSASKARYEKNYPSSRAMSKKVTLMSYADTELFLRSILQDIVTYADEPQNKLPECTATELWQKDHVWKYYKNANKTVKSTKNYDNAKEAYDRQSSDGDTGIIKYIPGEVIACRYCNVVDICDQAQTFIQNKLLIL